MTSFLLLVSATSGKAVMVGVDKICAIHPTDEDGSEIYFDYSPDASPLRVRECMGTISHLFKTMGQQ